MKLRFKNINCSCHRPPCVLDLVDPKALKYHFSDLKKLSILGKDSTESEFSG